jgi:hypothetical protein
LAGTSIDDLSKEELDILYIFVKGKYMYITAPAKLGYFLSVYKGIYDMNDVVAMLSKLVDKQYIDVDSHMGTAIYGIRDVSTYKNLRNIFKYRLYLDRILQFLKDSWSFLWRHFIITILVALITAYLYNRFFGLPLH